MQERLREDKGLAHCVPFSIDLKEGLKEVLGLFLILSVGQAGIDAAGPDRLGVDKVLGYVVVEVEISEDDLRTTSPGKLIELVDQHLSQLLDTFVRETDQERREEHIDRLPADRPGVVRL